MLYNIDQLMALLYATATASALPSLLQQPLSTTGQDQNLLGLPDRILGNPTRKRSDRHIQTIVQFLRSHYRSKKNLSTQLFHTKFLRSMRNKKKSFQSNLASTSFVLLQFTEEIAKMIEHRRK